MFFMFDLEPSSYLQLTPSRKIYLEDTAAPLDGMWEDAFFPTSNHWNIHSDGKLIGYCAVNAEGALLGFHVLDPTFEAAAFEHCLDTLEIARAFVCTAEPAYLSLCLDKQSRVTVNTIMYEDDPGKAEPSVFPGDSTFRQIEHNEHHIAVKFGVDAIGADRDWLSGYYAERIEKNELYGLWRGEMLLAAGELRISPSQKDVADVGMIVATPYRKRGIATLVLNQLRYMGRQSGLRLICSTERENIGAQKAILKAGFRATHRILDMAFGDSC